ncbi:molybdopterin-guanine dinucleotide biosynthesis protein MobB [Proteinivorax hydrogeniformans]|uniref:Molybdopterin-guanine dinucleotide biosynthesis protein MobB n=1 Tax=Proteinivorax hydrogeniformans TaxID=1826727 RepID=A0AAU8HSZ4_9FIRM
MKLFSVIGITQSGKTTTIEKIITELKKRRFTVGSVKDIHFEKFAIDTEGTNTHRHYKAGSDLVTARGLFETDILYKRRLSIEEILRCYEHDFVVLEGVVDYSCPKIITAHNEQELKERVDNHTIAISGRISEKISSYKGVPALSALTEVDKLVDLILEKTYNKLPDFPSKCCNACGFSCEELKQKIIKKEKSVSDCLINEGKIELEIDGQKIDMVPFVKNILYNNVLAVAKELDGYKKGKSIKIKIGEE